MKKFLLIALSAVFLGACANSRHPNVIYTSNSTEVRTTKDKGSYVALAFSRAGNKVYLGRSYTSKDEAIAAAVSSCPYSDCRAAYVTNHDGCVAFAINNDTYRRWGKGSGENPEQAAAVAVKYCNAPLSNETCYPVTTLCPEY